MTILVCCPSCNRSTKVPVDATGKTVRCTGCRKKFVLAAGSGEVTVEWGPIGAGRKVSLSPGDRVTIGRTKESTVCLPGPLVSRRHASLDWVASEWLLRDLGSTNGTYVNNHRIKEIGLTDGSRVVIGDFALRLTVAKSGPSDLDRALDAMAVDEARSAVAAVVESDGETDAAGDSGAETALGRPALTEIEDQPSGGSLPVRRLWEHWGIIAALAVVVIIVVVLIINLLL